MVLRLYWPKAEALEGEWIAPPLIWSVGTIMAFGKLLGTYCTTLLSYHQNYNRYNNKLRPTPSCSNSERLSIFHCLT